MDIEIIGGTLESRNDVADRLGKKKDTAMNNTKTRINMLAHIAMGIDQLLADSNLGKNEICSECMLFKQELEYCLDRTVYGELSDFDESLIKATVSVLDSAVWHGSTVMKMKRILSAQQFMTILLDRLMITSDYKEVK